MHLTRPSMCDTTHAAYGEGAQHGPTYAGVLTQKDLCCSQLLLAACLEEEGGPCCLTHEAQHLGVAQLAANPGRWRQEAATEALQPAAVPLRQCEHKVLRMGMVTCSHMQESGVVSTHTQRCCWVVGGNNSGRCVLVRWAAAVLTSGAMNSLGLWCSGPRGQQKGASAWSTGTALGQSGLA
jgi:hypothetical protein